MPRKLAVATKLGFSRPLRSSGERDRVVSSSTSHLKSRFVHATCFCLILFDLTDRCCCSFLKRHNTFGHLRPPPPSVQVVAGNAPPAASSIGAELQVEQEEKDDATIPPTERDPFGGTESRDMAKARVRSSRGQGAQAWLRATPTDRAREFPSNEFTRPPAFYGASAVPLQQGRWRDHNRTRKNLPPRWSSGEHARAV